MRKESHWRSKLLTRTCPKEHLINKQELLLAFDGMDQPATLDYASLDRDQRSEWRSVNLSRLLDNAIKGLEDVERCVRNSEGWRSFWNDCGYGTISSVHYALSAYEMAPEQLLHPSTQPILSMRRSELEQVTTTWVFDDSELLGVTVPATMLLDFLLSLHMDGRRLLVPDESSPLALPSPEELLLFFKAMEADPSGWTGNKQLVKVWSGLGWRSVSQWHLKPGILPIRLLQNREGQMAALFMNRGVHRPIPDPAIHVVRHVYGPIEQEDHAQTAIMVTTRFSMEALHGECYVHQGPVALSDLESIQRSTNILGLA